ncbi:MAG: AarF/UbiB family protein [Oligoflexia bacterium]|nr:AarF/UbiB family protein [Oligoflexia bacterium]
MITRLTPAARLLRLREFLGLSQRELANEFGVSYGAVGFWEKGERPIPGPVLKLIELHEQHFLRNEAGAVAENECQALSAQWAHAIVSKSRLKSKKASVEIRQQLEAVIARLLMEGFSADPVQRRIQVSIAGRLVRSLGESRGIPLKAAQLASYLDFNIPDELREALLAVQTHARPMSAGTVSRVIFEEFGKRPERLFAEWSSKPFAAASIGQVHRARLFSGEQVAVKIQYPDLLPAMKKDLSNLNFFRHLAALLDGANREVVDEFKECILRECDYRLEAESQQKFRSLLKGDPDIIIPRVFQEYSGARVLTTEFIDGRNLCEFMAHGTQAEKDKAGKTIVRFYTQLGFKYGTFQADPNPGNYIFIGDRIAFLDFGRVVSWDDRTRCLERDLCMAMLENDSANGRHFLEELGLIGAMSDKDFTEFWEFVSAQHAPLTMDRPFQYSRGLIRQRIRMAKGFRKNPMSRVTRELFWDVFLSMSANAIRGDLGSTANWRRHLLEILVDAGAKPRV